MPDIDQTSLHNRPLRQLRPEAFAHLAPRLVAADLCKDYVLAEAHQPFVHATFPERGIVSVITVSPAGRSAESGLVGHDGFAPMGLALNADRSPHRTVVQVPGRGYRIAADALQEAIVASPALQRLLLHFAHALAVQTAYTTLSNAVHTIDVRLARWLLMCHDRLASDEMALTHEYLSTMLGVRRASVTLALHVLEGHRFIRSEMGRITVTDRQELQAFAADAYGQAEAEYDRVLGPLK